MPDARRTLLARDPRAYLELHIEQGPVLEAMDKPTGVVIGTYGVERHVLRFTGQAAHSGSAPVSMSHCKEDTPEPYLEQTIEAFLRLVEKTVAAVAAE